MRGKEKGEAMKGNNGGYAVRKKYVVTMHTVIHGPYGEITEETKVLGETFAVSAAKAVNNVKYRLGIKKQKDHLYGPATYETFRASEV